MCALHYAEQTLAGPAGVAGLPLNSLPWVPEEREGICKISNCYSLLRKFINITQSEDHANVG